MKVLVTGAAGFIGSHLCEKLLALGFEVFAIDRFSDYYSRRRKEKNVEQLLKNPKFALNELDLADAKLESLLDGVSIIFHLAAQPGVRASWGANFDIYLRDNVLATQRLLETVKDVKIEKFVYASSSSIYGDSENLPTKESFLPLPKSPYGATKLAAEHLCYLYWRNFGVPTVSLRYFTVFGPRQRPDMAFYRIIASAIKGEKFTIYGTGEQSRDFTFVSDAVDATISAAKRGICGRAYNIGGGNRATLSDVINLVEKIAGKKVLVEYKGAQKGDVMHTLADTSLAKADLGYNPCVRLEDGLRAQFEWFLKEEL